MLSRSVSRILPCASRLVAPASAFFSAPRASAAFSTTSAPLSSAHEVSGTAMHQASALPPTPDQAPLSAAANAAAATARAIDASATGASSGSDKDGKEGEKQSRERKAAENMNMIRIGDVIVGSIVALGVVEAVNWLTDFPHPNADLLAAARASPIAQEHVGADLHRSYFRPWTGTVNKYSAKVRIPVTGSKGSGVVHAQAIYIPSRDDWEVLTLQLAVPALADRLTDLLPASPYDNTAPYVPSPNDPSALIWPPADPASAAQAGAAAPAGAVAPAAAEAAPAPEASK